MSTTNVRLPARANASAKLITVVVLPTPPFWLATESVRANASIPVQPAVTVEVARKYQIHGAAQMSKSPGSTWNRIGNWRVPRETATNGKDGLG
jgi:hypothetical protein